MCSRAATPVDGIPAQTGTGRSAEVSHFHRQGVRAAALKTLSLVPKVEGQTKPDETLARVYLAKLLVTEARDPETIKALATGGAVPQQP